MWSINKSKSKWGTNLEVNGMFYEENNGSILNSYKFFLSF